MSSTQTISLEALHPEGAVSPKENQTPQTLETPQNSAFGPTNPDAIIAASRLADANVPDGGYGWVVIFACAMLTFWFVGTTYSWGVMQAALVERKLSSPSTISFMGSLACALISFCALANAGLIRRIGARSTALVGVALLGGGNILSGFTTKSVGGLFMNTGVICGFGCSMLFMVIATVPAQYFSKKRGIANGIVYAGGGLGGACISFGINALIQKLGPEWTFRVLGLVILATGIPSALLIKERAPLTNSTFVEWSLFKNPQFSVLFFAGALATFPLPVAPFFLPLYCATVGLTPSTGAGLVAGFNFSSAVGRICCGFLADSVGPVNTLFLSLILSALSMLIIWPVSDSLAPLIVFVVINGAANGGYFSTVPTVVGNLFGSQRVGVAMGMLVSGWAPGYLMGAPIAGYLLAAYGGEHSGLQAYHPSIFYAGSMALASALGILVIRLRISRSVFARL